LTKVAVGAAAAGAEAADERDDAGNIVARVRPSSWPRNDAAIMPRRRFPVLYGEARDAFERGEGMAEIQDFAEAGLAFIAADNRALICMLRGMSSPSAARSRRRHFQFFSSIANIAAWQ